MGGPSSTPIPPSGSQPAPLDVYKKITVIRDKDDCVVYEDSQGRLQRISNLGEEALSAVSLAYILVPLLLNHCVLLRHL
jgi:hypothetical protein